MEIFNDTYCVYIHTNKANNKMYIGQTKNGNDPNKRWANGNGYRYCCRFWNAIQKYSWDNFEHEVIASNLTLDEANHFEELLISVLDTTNPENGYNLKSGGENNLCSEETKQKISEAHKGQHHSEEARRKMSEAHKGENNHNYGKPMSDEQKMKLSELLKGKRGGIDNPFYGGCHSEETKQMMSKIAKERLQNPKNHHNYGKHLSDETRRKISESRRGNKSPQARKVDQYDLNGNFIRTWDYIKQAASELNINVSSISECCSEKYKRKTAGGFKWFYSDYSTQTEEFSSTT